VGHRKQKGKVRETGQGAGSRAERWSGCDRAPEAERGDGRDTVWRRERDVEVRCALGGAGSGTWR
jgi:hypothetical protein